MLKKKHRIISIMISSILVISMVFASTTVSFASGNKWYDSYITLNNSVGGTIYTSTDSGDLAWGESYILNSYIDMYKLTNDTSWLDNVVTHVNTVISNANDDD